MNLFSKIRNAFNKSCPDLNEPPVMPKNEIISVLMQDGTVEQYPENFRITDGINAAYCEGCDEYHTHLDCSVFKMQRSHRKIIAVYRKESEKRGIFQCYRCKEYDEED